MLIVGKKEGKESPGPQVHSTNLFFTICFKNRHLSSLPNFIFFYVVAFSLLPLSLPNVVFFSPVILLKPEKTGKWGGVRRSLGQAETFS